MYEEMLDTVWLGLGLRHRCTGVHSGFYALCIIHV